MLKQLVKLANHLDNLGHADLADQLDSVIKMAQDAGTDRPLDRGLKRVTTQALSAGTATSPDTSPATSPATSEAAPAATPLSTPEETVEKDKYPIITSQVKKLKELIQSDDELKEDNDVIDAMTELEGILKTPSFNKGQVYAGLRKVLTAAQKIRKSKLFQQVSKALDEVSIAVTNQDLSGKVVSVSPAPETPAPAAAVSDAGVLIHLPGTTLRDGWGTYKVISNEEVRATSSQGKAVTIRKGSYAKWNDFVAALNKLNPNTTPSSVQAQPAPQVPAAKPAATAPQTPAATAPAGTTDAAVVTQEKAKIDSLERLKTMIKALTIYPKGYFSLVNFPDIAKEDMGIIGNPNGPISGSVVQTRIQKILTQRLGKLKAKSAFDSEEKIEKIAESLEELSFDFSRVNGSVRR